MPRQTSESSIQYLDRAASAPATALPLTLSIWFRHTNQPTTEELLTLHLGAGGDTRYGLWLYSDKSVLATARNDAAGGQAEAQTLATSAEQVWHHGAAVFTSTSSRAAYLNGANKATNAAVIGAFTPAGVGIGKSIDVQGFTGQLAHAAIWTAALDDAEIAALAAGFDPRMIRPDALAAYWPLESDAPLPDFWRGRLDLSNGGSTAYEVTLPPYLGPTTPRLGMKMSAPGVPVYIFPPDESTGNLVPVTLLWYPTPSAVLYDIYLDTVDPPVTLLQADHDNVSIATPPIAAMDGSTWYWRVIAKNGAGSTEGPVWSFSMLAPPETPSGPHPADGEIGVSPATSLTWYNPGDADHWAIWLDTVDPPLALLADDYPFAYYPSPVLETGVHYYWRVIAVNAAGTALGPVWDFYTTFGRVFTASHLLEAQLGPGFRSALINAQYNCGTWPLSELARLQARDVSGQNNHGTYEGTGIESGISFAVPEGCLGTYFNGDGFVEILDPGISSEFNLSLAGGDIDIAVLVRNITRDPVYRAIICKHDGAHTTPGDGWYVEMYNGQVGFLLAVGGVVIFNFFRGNLEEGDHEYLITCCYRTVPKLASIAIDGVVQFPYVSVAVGVEPAVTAAPVRIGHFCDGVAEDGLGFKGAIAYPSIGREGEIDLGPTLQAQREWTDITPHVRTATPIQTRTGIAGNGPSDNVASTGSINFVLDNGYRDTSAIGYYTPGHPLVRDGWGIGTPLRLSFEFGVLTYYEFLGRLATVTPLAGYQFGREADCMGTDWIDVAASTPLSALAAQLNQPSGYVAKCVLDQAQGRSPARVDIHAGARTWPFAIESGESERDTILTELSRIASSERGFFYIRGDNTRGGLFKFEEYGARIDHPILAEIDNTMRGLEVKYALDALVNIVRVTYNPRAVDAAPVTLYSLEISQHEEPLLPGEVRVFEGGYVDPTNQAQRVGGTDLDPIVIGTNIALNAAADGSGASMNADLVIVSQVLGGNSYRLEVRNDHATDTGYLWLTATEGFRITGLGIYHYQPVTIERRDNDSVRERGPRVLEINLGYESDGAVAAEVAEYYLELYGVEQPIPSSLEIVGNTSSTMMRYALGLQPGDKISLGEPMTGLSPAWSYFIVHEKRLEYTAQAVLSAAFTLAPAPVSMVLRRPRTSQSGSV